MKGGRRDQFYFCLLEYFENEERWFLKSLLQVKDEEGMSGDDAIRSWIEKYDVWQMVLDFPLSQPACATCLLDCPGAALCPEPSVKEVRRQMEDCGMGHEGITMSAQQAGLTVVAESMLVA